MINCFGTLMTLIGRDNPYQIRENLLNQCHQSSNF